MLKAGAFFEVADGELDNGVGAVELISGGGVVVGVGDERVVPPVGPQSLLRALGESGAAHHEANGAPVFAAAGDVVGLGDLGMAAFGVGDVGPGVVGDCLDRCAHSGSERDGDRPLDAVGVETVDQLVGPEQLASIGAPVEGDGTGTDQLPEASGAFAPGPHYTAHVTPLAGLRAALGETDVTYSFGCADSGDDTSGIAEAVQAASADDVAIVCVGARSGLVMDSTVGEARDATDLDLPGVQSQLVTEVAATGTPTVVVVISGRVHTLETEAESANAVLWSILPGEEGGNAIAGVLTGAVNPAGRLPVSMPRHVGQVPLHHDMRNRGDRSEFYGNYVDRDVAALYWFGHGLSYTTFDYGLKQIEDFLAAREGVDFDRVAETTQHPASGGSGLEPIGTQKAERPCRARPGLRRVRLGVRSATPSSPQARSSHHGG